MPRAALFDLDRTLVRKETASLYIRYQMARGQATKRDLARVFAWVVQYTFGVLDHEAAASSALSTLAGIHETVLAARCDECVRSWVMPHVSDAARRAVAFHEARGDVVAIVTGGSPYVARPVARALGIPHVVASELEIDGTGCFTGRFVPPLCVAEGKVTRAERFAREQGFRLEESVFYTDSLTDLPLLLRVAEPIVVNPDPRLRRVAKQRGWRFERW
jgi:HAD superfamily hydrolase (TIGR01490 family)